MIDKILIMMIDKILILYKYSKLNVIDIRGYRSFDRCIAYTTSLNGQHDAIGTAVIIRNPWIVIKQ